MTWVHNSESRDEHRKYLEKYLKEFEENNEDLANIFRDCLTVLDEYERGPNETI